MGQRGHTLLEIIVVIVILGILGGTAVLTLRGDSTGERLSLTASRLADLVRSQCEDALLESRSIALRPGPEGYRFEVWEAQRWLPHPDPLYRPRSWPVPLRVALEVDGLTLGAAADGGGETPILCLASGELVPFELTLAADGPVSVRLTGQATGQVVVEGP